MKPGYIYRNRHCGDVAEVIEIDYTYGYPIVVYKCNTLSENGRWALNGTGFGHHRSPSWDSCWELIAIPETVMVEVRTAGEFYCNYGSHVAFSSQFIDREQYQRMKRNYVWGEPQTKGCAPFVTEEMLKQMGTVGLYHPVYQYVEVTTYRLVSEKSCSLVWVFAA